MPIKRIRFDNDLPDQTQEIQLGDKKYRLRAWWNPRTLKWMLDVLTEDGEAAIIRGDALNNGSFPGSNSLDFPVELACAAPEVQKMNDLWNGNIRLYYLTADE